MGQQPHDPDSNSLRLIEILISRVLFWGALISIAIATTGLVVYIIQGHLGADLQDQLSHPEQKTSIVMVSIPQLLESLRNGSNPLAVSDLGLLLLLLVPVLSVALLIPAFIKEHDYRYSIMAGIVLLILLLGLVLGSE